MAIIRHHRDIDSLGSTRCIVFPDGTMYEHRDVPYIKLPKGELITPDELPGKAISVQVYGHDTTGFTGRLWLPKVPSRQGNYTLQKRVTDELIERSKALFNYKNSLTGLPNTASRDKNFGYDLKKLDPINPEDGVLWYYGQAEPTSGVETFKRLAKEYEESKHDPSQAKMALQLGGSVAAVSGLVGLAGLLSGHLELMAVGAVGITMSGLAIGVIAKERAGKPDELYQTLLEKNELKDELVKMFGIYLGERATDLVLAKDEYDKTEIRPDLTRAELENRLPKKKALRERIGKLESILETGKHTFAFMAQMPESASGFGVRFQTRQYDTLKELFEMLLGYRAVEQIGSIGMYEAKREVEKGMKATSTLKAPEKQEPLEITIQRDGRKLDAKDLPQYDKEYLPGCNGEYQILELLGEGAYGRWYKAKDKKGKTVAIKVPLEGKREEFENKKIAKLKGVQHPNIVEVYEVADGENPHIVAEYVDGVDLRTLINTQRLPVEAATYIIAQVAKGVQRAHKEDIAVLHNDIKPENVLITKDGKIKLVDFGAAENLGEAVLSAGLKTRDVTGTTDYAPPERKGEVEGKVDKHSDVYSIAKLGYELLTGSRAIDPRGMTKLNKDIPLGLADAINQALVVPPELRTKDTDTLLSQLAKFPQRELRLKIATQETAEVKQEEIVVVHGGDTQKVERKTEKDNGAQKAKETAKPEPKQRRPDIEDAVRREKVRRLEAEAHTDWVPEEQKPKIKSVCE